MTVSYIAATSSVRTGVEDPYTFSITPSGNQRGFALGIVQYVGTTDHIVAVDIGGVAMTDVVRAVDSAGEPGSSNWWFVGSGLVGGTGAQTVTVDLSTATTDDLHFLLVEFGGAANLEVVDSDGTSGDITDPSLTMQVGGRNAIAVGALYSGLANVSGSAPNANMTAITSHDQGNFVLRFDRQTTVSASDFTFSYVANPDDVALTVISVTEVLPSTGRSSVIVG